MSNMKIVGNFKIYAGILAIILVLAVVVGAFTGWLNLGIDFTGGTLITVEIGQDFESSDVEAVLGSIGISEYSVAKTGDSGTVTQASIRIKSLESVEAEEAFQQNLVAGLKGKYPDVATVSSERVGAVAGKTLIQNALMSVAIAGALMLVYIWIRFELVSGVIAIITSVLNLMPMVAVMIFFRSFFQVNSSFIAACLTILGYSINNTIIVFDRIREENRRYSKRAHTRCEVAEISVKRSLGRMVNSTVTSLITITVLYFMGVDSIKEFALPLIVGMAFGTYISVFIAPALWGLWMDRTANANKQGAKAKKA